MPSLISTTSVPSCSSDCIARDSGSVVIAHNKSEDSIFVLFAILPYSAFTLNANNDTAVETEIFSQLQDDDRQYRQQPIR